MNHRKSLLTAFLVALSYTLTAIPALAADTEIYEGGICTTTTTEERIVTNQTTVPANVVFIIDTSGSMRRNVGGTMVPDEDPSSRLNIVKGVFRDLIDNTSGINIAVMRFDSRASGNKGGYFIQAMQELNDANRTTIRDSVEGLTAYGATPLAETLYEATQFYRGDTVKFGNSTEPDHNVDDVLTTPSGSTYKSPISQDSKNFIVLLTDGEPNGDTDADSDIELLLDPSGNTSCTDNCLDELAGYLHTSDLSATDGTQSVTTYTIGFTTNQTLLQDTATKGGGQYFTTSTATGLTDALTEILTEITTETVTVTTTSTDEVVHTRGTFIAPAIGVDAFNRTSHRNALYFALFQNNANAIWDGNVKAYELGGDPLRIVDRLGHDVLDASGHFVATSRSLWSDDDDGDAIISGGANGQIPVPASRTLYTKDSNSAGALTELGEADPTLFGLTAAQTAERDAYVATALGSIIADPLHSQPVVVNYGGTEAAPDVSLFLGTNAGFLHAINAITGAEHFAYIPKELLPSNRTHLGQPGPHLDGLDGSPVVWKTDANNNGLVDGSDHVYLYIGMRRGGSNYYALDVTDRSKPELKWVIEGGSGSFGELAQTWSKPVLATMMHNGTATKVLVFAGGYSSTDTAGRALYIVNAATGARLWWAGPSTLCTNSETCLTHSIPSDVRVIDSNRDGYADRLYVGDMGGHIFRVDFTDSSGISGSVTMLASLGGESPNNRRFFNSPDVVLTQPTPGAPLYFSINIGSGDREHPKTNTTTQDRFYSIRDYHVHSSDFTGYSAVTEAAMLDVTSNAIGGADEEARQTAIDALSNASNYGWYIRLTTTGEKVLAASMTINGTIYFTTYVPPTTGLTDCPPPIGNGRAYKVSLFSGTPVQGSTPADRFIALDTDGIPPGPVLVFVPDPEPPCTIDCEDEPPRDPTPVVCTGPQCDPDPVVIQMVKTYWNQQR